MVFHEFQSTAARQAVPGFLGRVSFAVRLAHLFLLAGTYLVPEEWLSSPRPAEARRQVVVTARMVRKVEPEKEGNRQASQERLPSVVKTSEEQESATRPSSPVPEQPQYAPGRRPQGPGQQQGHARPGR